VSDAETLRDMLTAGGVDRVYAPNKVPPKPGYPYAVLGLAPGAPAIRTLDGSGDPLGRFTVQHFGQDDEALEDVTAITFATFDAKELPLAGEPVCTQELTSGLYRDPDTRGVLNVTHPYRY
jgi:hypothetical protein